MLQLYARRLKLKPIVARELPQPLPGLFLNLVVIPGRHSPSVRMLGDVEPEGLDCFDQDRDAEAPGQR